MLGKHFIVGFPPIPVFIILVFIILVVTHFSSLLRRQSNPLRRQSNPLRRQSNPLRRQSNPLRRQSNPLRRQSNPLRRQSNPLRRQSNPLRRQSNPLRRQSNPLRRQSNPLRRQSNPLRRQSNPLVYAVLYYCTISCFKSRWVARIYVVASDWLWTSEGGGRGADLFKQMWIGERKYLPQTCEYGQNCTQSMRNVVENISKTAHFSGNRNFQTPLGQDAPMVSTF